MPHEVGRYSGMLAQTFNRPLQEKECPSMSGTWSPARTAGGREQQHPGCLPEARMS